MQWIDREEAIIVALVGHLLPQHFHHTKVHHLGFPSSHRLALSVKYVAAAFGEKFKEAQEMMTK